MPHPKLSKNMFLGQKKISQEYKLIQKTNLIKMNNFYGILFVIKSSTFSQQYSCLNLFHKIQIIFILNCFIEPICCKNILLFQGYYFS